MVKLVVLDMDGVQIDSDSMDRAVLRPYLLKFLEFLFTHYDVAIWTNAKRYWVEEYLSRIPMYKNKFVFIWTREKCQQCTYASVKPLIKIWRSSIGRTNGYTKHNTIIIEDTPENCVKNYGNAIYVEPFDLYNKADNTLLHLIEYIKSLFVLYDQIGTIRNCEKRSWYDESNLKIDSSS
jgi:RNA polymerase II subunit A small phosphatase-like protein